MQKTKKTLIIIGMIVSLMLYVSMSFAWVLYRIEEEIGGLEAGDLIVDVASEKNTTLNISLEGLAYIDMPYDVNNQNNNVFLNMVTAYNVTFTNTGDVDATISYSLEATKAGVETNAILVLFLPTDTVDVLAYLQGLSLNENYKTLITTNNQTVLDGISLDYGDTASVMMLVIPDYHSLTNTEKTTYLTDIISLEVTFVFEQLHN